MKMKYTIGDIVVSDLMNKVTEVPTMMRKMIMKIHLNLNIHF